MTPCACTCLCAQVGWSQPRRACGCCPADCATCQHGVQRSCFLCVYHIDSDNLGSRCMLFGEPIYNEEYEAELCEGFETT